MERKKLKKINIQRKILLFLISISTLFMSIGYASINSISLNINGIAQANSQNEVFITDVVYKENINSDKNNSEIINIHQSTLTSKIQLSETEVDSSITYTITVYNSTEKDYIFVGTLYDEEFYSNNNITFSLTNLNIEDSISSKEYLTFDITFKYAENVTPNIEINELTSYLNFKFEPFEIKETLSGIEFNYLVKNGEYSPEGDVYEYYSVDANRLIDHTIKIIEFGKTSDYETQVSNLTKEPIDLYQTGSISLYRELLSDGKYKIYILSDSGKFILNENSAWMFDKLYDLEEIINLHFLDTSNVVNMRDMFCDCASLKNVDLSNFNTSKVTNMIGMFARMTVIEYLDLSTFDTKNVEEIGQMFTTDTALKRIYVSDKWQITDKITAENGAGLFTNCTNLVGGNGTIYDSTKITYTMAVVDTATNPGYLTKGYKFINGTEANHIIKNLSQTEKDAWTLSNRYANENITEITFGQTRDYYSLVRTTTPTPIDNDKSGALSLYRILNNDGKYTIYILSNNNNFILNEDSAWMFDKLIFLNKINNLNLLDSSNVVNMRDIFCDCQTIKTLDLSNFSTISATTFEGMFARNYSIEELDLSNFTTNKVTTMKNMFYLGISTTDTHANYQNVIPALKTIYVSSTWTNQGITTISEGVFGNNLNLVGGSGTIFNSSNLSAEYAVIDSDTKK